MEEVYQRLREHLDKLPASFPATESGVELRILKRLFTPQEAALAAQLGLKLETAKAIAAKAGLTEEEAEGLLAEMARKGLIFSIDTGDRPPAYMAAQFMVGIWEYQVNRLDPEFIKDTDEYLPFLAKEAFNHLPQLRTIPVNQSLTPDLEVLAYEQAEELVRAQQKILVAPCICRRERQIMDQGCAKPLETCLIFGWAADYYQRNGLGRIIDQEETLQIIREANEAGLVLQPSNSQDITAICCCCGDCCQVLRNLKRHPAPAQICSSPFLVSADPEACLACETCLERCQMDALEMGDDSVKVLAERCIGCGLCVSTCPGEALSLVRKPEHQQPRVPAGTKEAMAERARARAAAKAELESKLRRHQDL